MISNEKFILHKGDCLELMNNIPDNSIDMVLTDPPYGTTVCKWDRIIDFDLMWKQLKRITKDNGAICLFGKNPFTAKLIYSNIKDFKYNWVWHKNKPANIFASKYEPMNYHEEINVFCKGKTKYYKQMIKRNAAGAKRLAKGNANIKGTFKKDLNGKNKKVEHPVDRYSPDLKNPSTVLKFNNSNKNSLHPTQKPVPLLSYLIKTYSLENETVLDFTMGSGSTGIACLGTNRKFIGIEKDENYFEVSKKRIVKFNLRLEKNDF
jgi:site-specific DNA-methyltransferase (adenine-specific)